MATIKRRVGGTNPTTVKRREYFTAFSPSSIAGCALWLDGADPAANGVIPAAGNLATWVDKSGGGINAIAGTAVYPQYTTSFLNGLGVVGLTNASDYFTVANNLNTSSLTYVFLMKPTAANTGTYCAILSTDTPSLYGRSIALNNMNFQIEYYTNFTTTSITTNSSTWYIVSVVFNGTSSITLSYNGTISTYAGSGTGTNSNGLTIGSYNSTSSYTTYNANFYLAEAVVYTSALSQPQYQQVESYLAQKWGLTGSLPAGHSQFTQPAGKPNTITNPTPGLFPVLKPIITTFSPLSTSPGLWLDANDYSTFTFSSGTNISSWADKSGNARNATGVNSPVYTDTSAYLSGSAYFTVNLDFIASFPDHSAFFVITPTNGANIYGAINGGSGANSLHVGFSSTTAYRVNHWGNDWYPNTTAAYRSGGLRNLLNFDWINTGGAGKAVRANGSVEGTIGQTGQIGVMSGGGTIGNVVQQGILTGYINEVIFILNPNITTTNRNKLEGYLAWKWGIQSYLPAGHPYLSAPP